MRAASDAASSVSLALAWAVARVVVAMGWGGVVLCYCSRLTTKHSKPALSNGAAAILATCEGLEVLLCQVDEAEAEQTTGGDGSERGEWDSVH